MLKQLNLLLKLLIVVGYYAESSSFVEAVECSSFVEAVESVVVKLLIVVGYYVLYYVYLHYVLERALVLLKLLLKLLIVVGYYVL